MSSKNDLDENEVYFVYNFDWGKVLESEFKHLASFYDKLYEEAELVLRKYNPCNIKNGLCINGVPCCEFCGYLSSKKVCMVKSLACKLFLCEKAKSEYHECTKKLDEIKKIAARKNFLGYRSSKKDIFSCYEIIK